MYRKRLLILIGCLCFKIDSWDVLGRGAAWWREKEKLDQGQKSRRQGSTFNRVEQKENDCRKASRRNHHDARGVSISHEEIQVFSNLSRFVRQVPGAFKTVHGSGGSVSQTWKHFTRPPSSSH